MGRSDCVLVNSCLIERAAYINDELVNKLGTTGVTRLFTLFLGKAPRKA
jgi:hypothetical protein